ncbi:rCG28384 [Rattus norvegicus]|uniref:RCG28384 n=2 Tax=Myomorpha TaxID=1963758 RepID=A6KTY4_RAT|nr:rCG28384 [Rattus norvegicus]
MVASVMLNVRLQVRIE